MKKVLLVTTVSGFVPQFEMNSVNLLQENGYEVHYATNYNHVFYGKDNSRLNSTNIICHQIDFSRSPYSKQTLVAYRQLDKLLKEIKFEVIHCHTPLGSMIARLVGKKNKVQKVIYTAHGFHFYKGAHLINWGIYYPIEKIMARYTDAIITINNEDFLNAQKFKLKNHGQIYYMAGAGIDIEESKNDLINLNQKREELRIKTNDFVILSVGELNKNKNHETVIRGLSKINHSNIKYLICGEGVYKEKLKGIIDSLKMQNCVQLLGYRMDVSEIEKIADLFVFPSFREGLPVSMMEAMANGLPVIASNIRGNMDLVKEGINGFLLNPKMQAEWGRKILELKNNKDVLAEISQRNIQYMKKYEKTKIKKQLESIYKEIGII